MSNYLITLQQHLVRHLEVVIVEDRLQEVGDRVLVNILELLDDLHELVDDGATALVDDDRRRKVAENVRARGLHGVHVAVLVQELDEAGAPVAVVEEDEETPMDEPRAIAQLRYLQ